MSPRAFQIKWPDPAVLNNGAAVLVKLMNYARAYKDGAQLLIADNPLGPETNGEATRRCEAYRRTLQAFLNDMAAPNETFTVLAQCVLGGFVRLDISQLDSDEEGEKK